VGSFPCALPLQVLLQLLSFNCDVCVVAGSKESLLKIFCNEVAPFTCQLQSISINLNIEPVDFKKIKRNTDNEEELFVQVMEKWRRQGSPPFTLKSMVQALESESVRENSLAKDLRSKYMYYMD
jgi:hypothetical protein